MGKPNEEKPELASKILDLRKSLLESQPNIKCLVITALENDSDQPVVIYHGDQLEYTSLAVAVAGVLRKRVMDRIGGNDVHVHQSQQALSTNIGAEQGNHSHTPGQGENSS